jgi:UDP-N-acetylglucosamine 2-epimerase (non-hydrolysing)/GDP/UDP-N,N'-diacetylbacillosamine 2-epimerase (hydrolysing)
MKEIKDDPDLELMIIVTGMHLAPEFGLTYESIEADGFYINEKVEMLLSSDTPVGIAKSIGLGVIGIAEALARLNPDILVLFGDRFEIFAAAQAAMLARLPIAHISGGEITEGAIDDAIRHSLSKMSSYHFVSAESYRLRLIQMGEEPAKVMNCGDLGIENIHRLKLIGREELSTALGFNLVSPFFLVTFHPETLTATSNADNMNELFAALDLFQQHRVIMTKANADEGGRLINRLIDQYRELHSDRVYTSTSLGQLNYLSAMSHCEAVVGNSSSGIVEAPALTKATVNIGKRQDGRLMAKSIICCPCRSEDIGQAMQMAIDADFKQSLIDTISLYGRGNTSIFIKDYLKKAVLSGVVKHFYNIPENDIIKASSLGTPNRQDNARK